MNEIKQSVANFEQINKDVDGIVYNAYARPKSYYGYYGIYGNYSYQYYADKYLDDTYDYEKSLSLIFLLMLISGCSLSPGMHMDTKNSWSNESRYVYVDSIKKDVRLINISETLDASYKSNYLYRIGLEIRYLSQVGGFLTYSQ